MASVLAIVSKALFEKMVPKDVKLGTVVDIDRYVSSNKTFDGLAKGGAIFMVTVRPPDEKLWLVAVLEKPKKKGDAWVAASNATPLTDVTASIKKLAFESGAGLKAKKGALGMSLQTPRALTKEDEALLRGLVGSAKPAKGAKGAKGAEKPAKVTASDAYKAAVDDVLKGTKKKGKKGGDAKPLMGALRLERARKPFEGKIGDLSAAEKKQLESIVGKGKLAKCFADGGAEELAEVSMADVVDGKSGKVLYQLYLFGYGDGCLFEGGTTDVAADICQHGFDPREGKSKAFVQDFARAWDEGAKRLKLWAGHIDFDDDELGEEDDD